MKPHGPAPLLVTSGIGLGPVLPKLMSLGTSMGNALLQGILV